MHASDLRSAVGGIESRCGRVIIYPIFALLLAVHSGNCAVAQESHVEAKRSVADYYSAIRVRNEGRLNDIVASGPGRHASMIYRASTKSIMAASSLRKVVDQLQRAGIDVNYDRLLAQLPFYSYLTDPAFSEQLQAAPVYLGQSGDEALVELTYSGERWYVRTRKINGRWKVVLDANEDQFSRGGGLLAATNFTSNIINEAADYVADGEYELAEMKLGALFGENR